MRNQLFLILLFSLLFPDGLKKNGVSHQALTKKAGKTAAVTDRKYADHSGNRVLCRFYNFGATVKRVGFFEFWSDDRIS